VAQRAGETADATFTAGDHFVSTYLRSCYRSSAATVRTRRTYLHCVALVMVGHLLFRGVEHAAVVMGEDNRARRWRLGSLTARGPNLAAAAVGERLSGRINALIYSDGDTLEGEGRGQAIYI
jgi:hypothetical protein